MMLAIVLALGAAAVYGAATALQHHAASETHRPEVVPRHLVARLWRRPTWLVGLVLSGVAFALHVAALHRGPLTVVQPIVVTTVVFAVLVRAGLDRTPPIPAEIGWCVCTWVGLALFVGTVPPNPPHELANGRTALQLLGLGTAAAVVAVLSARRTKAPARRGFLLGFAAGILYGLTAGLIKVAASHASDRFLLPIDHWSTWLVVPMGLSAFFLSQWAYEATRLSVSVPTLNIVDVLTAVVFGSVVFGDHLFSADGRLFVTLLGSSMVGIGVWRLVQVSERLHESQAAAAAVERSAVADPDGDRRGP
jgi:drug/metabolite transporter (DMT)-like permease